MDQSAFALTGKVAVVTGAAQGIGRAIAIELATAGAAVACLDVEAVMLNDTVASIVAAGGKAQAMTCDVASETATRTAVDNAARAFGRIDILAHAAAIREPAENVEDLSLDDWNRVYAVAVAGAFLMAKWCVPHMRRVGGGSIILIASQLGSVAAPKRPAYCSSKGAVIQLAKQMAVDYSHEGIRVNSLSPGAVETDRLVYRYGSMDAARAQSGPKHLVGRLGQPQEIGRAAVFLASSASSFMTGADLLIDGGYNAV